MCEAQKKTKGKTTRVLFAKKPNQFMWKLKIKRFDVLHPVITRNKTKQEINTVKCYDMK